MADLGSACIDTVLHAALLPAGRLGRQWTFTPPAQVVRIGDLFDALQQTYPHSVGVMRHEPDAELQAQFAAQPPLTTAAADNLGFRHDGDLRN